MGQPYGDFPTPRAVMITYLKDQIEQLNYDYDHHKIDVEELVHGRGALWKVIDDLTYNRIKFT